MKSFINFFNDEYLAIESIERLDRTIFRKIINKNPQFIPSKKIILQQVQALNNPNQNNPYSAYEKGQQIQLLKTYKANPNSPEGQEARNTIIKNRMKYIYAIVHKLVNSGRIRGQNFQDAVQEGVLGLIDAIEKVDINKIMELPRGFSSFAGHYIAGAASNAFNYKRSRDITSGRAGQLVSMDATTSGDADSGDKEQSVAEKVPDNMNGSPDQQLEKNQWVVLVQDFLRRLPEKEAQAIQMYWLDEPRKTYEEIGQQLGMTKMGARMLTQRAQKKLREYAQENGYC